MSTPPRGHAASPPRLAKPASSLLLAALVACGGRTAPPAPATPSAPPPPAVVEAPLTAPALRLPRTFVPTSYAARLAVTPAEPQFHGHIEIAGNIAEASRVIWLHGEGLTFDKATAGDATLAVQAFPSGAIALRAPRPLAAGPIKLVIDYRGTVNDNTPEGVFRARIGDAWYAFTQFEATSARRAFPCFDEPDVKVPWQLTVDVPADAIALSNTPVASDKAGQARHAVEFAPTKPLPSYLIAFAVGPFELVDAGRTRSNVPLRIAVPRGQTASAATAKADLAPLLARLEDYLGSPYPYDKLDVVAVPGFPGAMENAGVITFSQSLLLEDPAHPAIAHRREMAEVAAHELAHQWFGDMVTMAWWDDTWLNEAFATWMAAKIVGQWQPTWGGAFSDLDEQSTAMRADQLATARKIREPIVDAGGIGNAFDAITYRKGASVLRMFERWIGADAFQRGVRTYLAARAWRNATANDFLDAIGQAAGRDITGPFATFLDRVGIPLVTVSLRCAPNAPPTVTLAQQRYRPLGGQAPAGGDPAWQLPVCVRYPVGKAAARDCVLLDRPTAELPLGQAKTCPAWIAPNADAIGYHRTALDGDAWTRLLAHLDALSGVERVGLINDAQALVAAGRLQAGDALALVERLARDPDRHVVAAAIRVAQHAGDVIEDAQRPNDQRFVRKVFGARARALGWIGKASDSEDARLLRGELVGFVADAGNDPALVTAATRLAWKWLDDRNAAPPDLAQRALAVVARRNDRALHARLLRDVERATNPGERAQYLEGLGQFSEPALVAATLNLVLTNKVNLFEALPAIFGHDTTQLHARAVYEAMKPHYDAIVAMMPAMFAPKLSIVGFALCEPALRDDVVSFFRDRLAPMPGGPQIFAQGTESMDACLAQRKAEQPSAAAFLARY